jgi:hypothetical protein
MDGEIIDVEHSEARGDFLKSLKKTYSRRKKSDRPKTFKGKLKRAGGLIPAVALAKAGGVGRNRQEQETRGAKKPGRRAMQKRAIARAMRKRRPQKPVVQNAKTFFKEV